MENERDFKRIENGFRTYTKSATLSSGTATIKFDSLDFDMIVNQIRVAVINDSGDYLNKTASNLHGYYIEFSTLDGSITYQIGEPIPVVMLNELFDAGTMKPFMITGDLRLKAKVTKDSTGDSQDTPKVIVSLIGETV